MGGKDGVCAKRYGRGAVVAPIAVRAALDQTLLGVACCSAS